jgi:hypothetical protein
MEEGRKSMLGSELVIRALAREGVRTIFSLSGNQIMPLYDACIDAGIRIVHVRHEAAAVFMADAWAQVTGEIGVAMLTAGPGRACPTAWRHCSRRCTPKARSCCSQVTHPPAKTAWGRFRNWTRPP